MGIWIGLIFSGICAVLCFYMAFIAFKTGDDAAFLLMAFGLFFAIFFTGLIISVAAKKSAFFKRANDKISGYPEPVSFVPHRFMLMVLTIAAIGIAAAILIPFFLK